MSEKEEKVELNEEELAKIAGGDGDGIPCPGYSIHCSLSICPQARFKTNYKCLLIS